jgi:hypothetical protein
MKYLKRYNEELTPANTKNLKTAAKSASQLNQPGRSDKFIDYSDVKEFGTYNIDLYRSKGVSLTSGLTFTEVTFDNVVYGRQNSWDKSSSSSAESCIEKWKSGDGFLAVTFDVCFRPTRETLNKIENSFKISGPNYTKLGSHLINVKNDYQLNEYKIPLFKMSVVLGTEFNDFCEDCGGGGSYDCQNCDGSGEEYYNGGSDSRDCPECNATGEIVCQTCDGTGRGEKIDIVDRFERDKCFILILNAANFDKTIGTVRSEEALLGAFSDRKSARKFQKELPSILEKSEVKSKIMDLLSILQADTEDIENVIDLFNNIPISSILPEKGKVSGPDDAKRFISASANNKRIKQIFPKKD